MEKENYTAYDLEPEVKADGSKAIKEKTEKETLSDSTDNSDNESTDNSDTSDSSDKDPARGEIENMMEEMGAAKVLELIRGNRNAAIEQIMTEVEQQTERTLQSGVSVGKSARSIFDLASMA